MDKFKDEVSPSYKKSAVCRSDAFGLVCPESDRVVKQEFKKECDINFIMKRFAATGMISHVNKSAGYYGDVSDVKSYAEAFAISERARMSFLALPAEVRRSMDNDPSRMGVWLADKANYDLAVKHGLIVPRKEVVTKVEVVNPPVVKTEDKKS